MIHIIHTPAATLASRRRRLAGHCSCWVVALGCIVGGWAVQIPVFQAISATPCNFTGVAFIPQEAPPAESRKTLFLQPAASAAPLLPPLPMLTPDCDVSTDEMELMQTEAADDLQLETDAAALLKPQGSSGNRQEQADAQVPASTYSPPAFRHCPEPPYPARLKQRRTQGSVGVLILINAKGLPSEVIITDSSGSPLLDRHTRNWILRNWRFSPARLGDIPQASQVKTSVVYSLL